MTRDKLTALASALLVFAALPPTLHANEGEALFQVHCGACHTLDKATTQRLNRADWNWVMDDMVDYGMTWLTADQREAIVDHLVENYGRDAPR